MKKSIALIWPKSTFLEKPMTWTPLGLMHLGAQLEKLGHKTEFFDLNEDELPKDGDFDQLWLSCTSPQIREARAIGTLTRDWKTKTVLGGALPWANPESAKKLEFDLIVGGEADYPPNLERILELLNNKPDDNYINVPVAKDLSWSIPPLRRWSYKYHSYMTDLNTGIKHRMSSIFGTRGCSMSCAFCESGRLGVIWDRFVRYENLDVIEKQIAEITEQGFTGIGFYDDILPLNKKRTLELLEIIKKYGQKWRCFLRTDIINKQGGKEYLQAMRDSGLIEIFVGIESADNQIKANIHKGTTIEQDENVLQWCRELGITFKGSIIIGLPGESRESLEKTRDWILSQNPEGIRIQTDRLIPFTGTPLTDRPELFDLEYEQKPDEEWFYKGRHDITSHSFVRTSNLSVEEIDIFWRELEAEMERRGFRA